MVYYREATEQELKISQRIRQLRKKLGLSQERLARVLGVPQNAVSRFENGGVPRWPLLIQLAQLAHTTIDWILRGDGPEPMAPKMPKGLREFLRDPEIKVTYNYTAKEVEQLRSILFTRQEPCKEEYVQLLLMLRRSEQKTQLLGD